MTDFYSFSYSFIVLSNILLVAAAAVQTLLLTGSSRALNKTVSFYIRLFMNLMLMLLLLTELWTTAETSYYAIFGFIYVKRRIYLRYFATIGTAVLLALYGLRTGLVRYFAPIPPALMAMPLMEELFGSAYPGIYMITELIMLLWLGAELAVQLIQRRQQLSELSVKEAMDELDTGLLFYKSGGQILLQNNKMQSLMIALTGSFHYNGADFAGILSRGEVLPQCVMISPDSPVTYCLPDGSIWQFSFYPIETKLFRCELIAAEDLTEQYESAKALQEQNAELKRKNSELAGLMKSLETVCEAEAAIEAKSRIHDVLGQRISLLLRVIREQKRPEPELLRSLAGDLPRELTELSSEGGCRLETLAKVFQGLGVSVNISGSLPAREDISCTLYEIAAEAVTNAVRHGYAAVVDIRLMDNKGLYTMDIENRGLSPAGAVCEGGGIKGMREKTRRLGGSFFYEIKDGFHIHVELPSGGI